jgi:hypothetical protein
MTSHRGDWEGRRRIGRQRVLNGQCEARDEGGVTLTENEMHEPGMRRIRRALATAALLRHRTSKRSAREAQLGRAKKKRGRGKRRGSDARQIRARGRVAEVQENEGEPVEAWRRRKMTSASWWRRRETRLSGRGGGEAEAGSTEPACAWRSCALAAPYHFA